MAVDQRIQTTITAGRGGGDSDQGPIMVILLSCLAVAMCFTTLGIGFVNIASGNLAAKKRQQLASGGSSPAVSTQIEPALNISQEKNRIEETLDSQIASLERRKTELIGRKEAQTTQIEAQRQGITAERDRGTQLKQSVEKAQREQTQIATAATALRTRLSGNATEERNQEQLRQRLEEQLQKTRQQVAEADRRIQELQRNLAAAQKVVDDQFSIRLGDGAWIECLSDSLVLLPERERVTLQRLQSDATSLLKVVANRKIQFLIRPDGFASFNAARAAIEQHGITSYGYEPIDANWRVTFR